MKNRRNYYRILHVQPDAPAQVIRSSYRTMMQRMKKHPDLGGDCAEASLINEAYAVLRDPVARARYDEQLGPVHATASASPRADNADAAPAGNKGYPKTRTSSGQCGFCNLQFGCIGSISPEDVCHHCASPLYPAEKQRLGQDSQRAVDRIDRRHPLAFYTNGNSATAFTGRTRDISLHGMRFVSDSRLAVGDVIKVDTAICHATARVANCQAVPGAADTAWQIGVTFLTLRFVQASGSFVSARA